MPQKQITNLQREKPLFSPKDFDLSNQKNDERLTKIQGTMLINEKKIISLSIMVESCDF